MRTIFTVWLLAGLAFAQSQSGSPVGRISHAPNTEQCRADQRLWKSQQDDFLTKSNAGNDAVANGTELGRATFEQLNRCAIEMNDCVSVDPGNIQRYRDVRDGFDFMQHSRLVDFAKRHNLWKQFTKEDEDEGLR